MDYLLKPSLFSRSLAYGGDCMSCFNLATVTMKPQWYCMIYGINVSYLLMASVGVNSVCCLYLFLFFLNIKFILKMHNNRTKKKSQRLYVFFILMVGPKIDSTVMHLQNLKCRLCRQSNKLETLLFKLMENPKIQIARFI